MSRFNTGNPIDSNDPRDLSDNAKNLDQAINSESSQWTDRLGNQRKTFRAAENAAEAAEQAADEAVQTLIPQQVQRVEDRADEAVDTEIPAEVQRATEAADGTEQVLQDAQDALDAAEIDWEERFQAGQDDREVRFDSEQQDRAQAFQDFLVEAGYQELGEYEAGIEITQLNQVVTVGDYLYRVSPSVGVPYTTSGDWNEDQGDFIQIDFVTASQLAQERQERQSADSSLQDQITEAAPIAAAERPIVQWHGQVIENSLTIPDNVNAFTFGPTIEIADGQSVTVGDNSHWTIADGVPGNA